MSLLALSENTLTTLEWGYEVDIPIVKYIFTIFQSVDAGGMMSIIMAIAFGAVYYAVNDKQKNPWISASSGLIAIATVFGRSYMDTNSWYYIFHGKLQFGLAVFVMTGYYFLYKNILIYAIETLKKYKKLFTRCEATGKAEKLIFEKYPFLSSLLIAIILGLPYLICFFPGTMQWDAHAQLWQYIGVSPITGHHPVAVTKLMGKCVAIGRIYFHSDSIGLFLYTGPQFGVQCMVFAYTMSVLCRMKTPMWIRWCGLVVYFIYPIFPIWGFTLVKDTGYYICTLLFVAVLADVIYVEKHIKWWHMVLFAISTAGLGMFRNNGRYVVIFTVIGAVVMYRKYWKMYLAGLLVCFLLIFVVEDIYMPKNQIEEGPIGEMLSIPLQQTARYIREHYEEITREEREVLESLFSMELEQLAEVYKEEISDPVKENFVRHPTGEQLKQYFEVWFRQFLKHPGTYIQAALNHLYGYFYPDRTSFWGNPGVFYIGNVDHWQDGYLDIEFGMENSEGRDFLRCATYLIMKLPVVGMVYSCGLQGFILMGSVLYLLYCRKWREFVLLLPGICVFLICLVSPVNAYYRYMLPIVVVLPLTLAVCCQTRKDEKKEDIICE